MNCTLHAEWTKLRTTAGTVWWLLASIALTIGLGAIADASATCAATGCNHDPAKIGLTGIYLGQVLVAISAGTLISAEYSTGMISTTLTAMPRRAAVLAAKAAMAAGWALAVGVVSVVGSTLVGQLVLPGEGFTPANGYRSLSLSDPEMLRAASGSVLYLMLIALLSLGMATAVRDSAVGIGAVLGLLFGFPTILVMITNPTWHRHLDQIAPMNAGMNIQATVDLHSLTLSPWTGLGVLALWSAGALLLGTLVLHLRDA